MQRSFQKKMETFCAFLLSCINTSGGLGEAQNVVGT